MTVLVGLIVVLNTVLAIPAGTDPDPWTEDSVRMTEPEWDTCRRAVAAVPLLRAQRDSLIELVERKKLEVSVRDTFIADQRGVIRYWQSEQSKAERGKIWYAVGGALVATGYHLFEDWIHTRE